jgi:hypothetical protein
VRLAVRVALHVLRPVLHLRRRRQLHADRLCVMCTRKGDTGRTAPR